MQASELFTTARPRKLNTIEKEERLALALAGLQAGQWSTVYQAANNMKVSRHTLGRRWGGGKSRAEAREEQQHLTKAEEKVLAD